LLIETSSLRKVLALEQKKNYSNTAVIGGLDKFVRNWYSQVISTVSDPKLLKRIKSLRLSNPNYDKLTPESRQQWTDNLLVLIDDLADNKTTVPEKVVPPPPNKTRSAPRIKKPTAVSSRILNDPVTVIKGIGPSHLFSLY
jgi:hypothetical protein